MTDNNALFGFIAPSTADVATAAIQNDSPVTPVVVQKERKIYRRLGVTHICYKGKFFAPPVESETEVDRTKKMTSVEIMPDGNLEVFQAPEVLEIWEVNAITSNDAPLATDRKERKIYKRLDITHICFGGQLFAPAIETETKVDRSLKMTSVTPNEDGTVDVFQAPDTRECWVAKKF